MANTSSSHTRGARDLKIGMNNPLIDGSKVTNQFLKLSLKAEIFKFKVYIYIFIDSSHNFKDREKITKQHFLFKYLAKNAVK